LDLVIQDVSQSEKLFIGGGFNGHITAEIDEYDAVHRGFDYEERINGGVSNLHFAVAYELLVVNSFF